MADAEDKPQVHTDTKKLIEQTKGRPKLTRPLNLRISKELYDSLQEIADIFNNEMPGRITTVSDVARAILQRGIIARKRDLRSKGVELRDLVMAEAYLKGEKKEEGI